MRLASERLAAESVAECVSRCTVTTHAFLGRGAGHALEGGMPSPVRLRFGRVRAGFTIIEIILVLVIVAMLAALITPKVNEAITQSRVQNSAAVIAGDLQLAFSLANRRKTPLRLTIDPTGTKYTIATRAGTVIRERLLGGTSDLRVATL